MMLIGDTTDPSGNGMFSRSARQFNKFFINLNRPSNIAPKLYFNKAFVSEEGADTYKSKRRIASPTQFNEVETRIITRRKKKPQKEPFRLSQGRQYFQQLKDKQREGPTYGNYNPKPVESRVKGFTNYNLEKCRQVEVFQQNKENLKSSVSTTRVSCPRLVRNEEKLSQMAASGSRFFRITGFVEFDKQTDHQPIVENRTNLELEINPEVSYYRTQITQANCHCDFGKTLPREPHQEKRRFHRNNYALQVKRDLVEKKTVIMVPEFEKMLQRRSYSCKSNCLNPGFYNFEKAQLSTKTLSFGRMLPRGTFFANS